ncbi:uncharacterized protein LOC143613383 [Bidens hawaiensis]|uniref:uncharacterized protein LOC143613383 n=1 Tax=Bidens hawaiensis TaxID=980011 RepID=UPI00404B6DA1
MTDPEVDMSDYRMNVDTDVEDGDDLETGQPLDFGEDVIDNGKFLSGSESDENETSNRKHILHSSTIKIRVEVPSAHEATTKQFKRIYVCLASLKQGFKVLNRDLLGLDGAFMKDTFPGQMLTAVGLDSNNGIYHVCYAIVESESFSSWTWFLELLAEDLEMGWLLQSIQTLFPCAEHRYCLRHIHENMKLAGFRGMLYKNMLYKCATSTIKPEFLTAMNELKEFNKDAHLWLSKIAPQSWSRSHYSGLAVSDIMINNMYEVYNGNIMEGRDRPIISSLEYVREYLMRRIVTVLGIIDKCEVLLTPRATQLFEAIKKQANHYSVQWNGGDLYEVCPADMLWLHFGSWLLMEEGWGH